ncbi:Phage RNA polymerase binding, RpbA [compost metagenome]
MCEHDVNVRNAWVPLISEAAATKMKAIMQPARTELYQSIDAKIKDRYLETLRDLNKDLVVVQLKGFGPLRQSKNQQPLDMVLASVAHDVLTETGLIVSN